MKRFIHILVNVFVFSFLCLIQGIYGYLFDLTNPIENSFTIENKTTYTVIHQTMNLDGVGYTIVNEENGNKQLGTQITPEVMSFPGFTSPEPQTVTLNTWTNTVITYSYTRNKYDLTINDSEYVTTETPTGRYFYGTTIELTADEYDSNNNPFVRWSNGETTREAYSFQLLEDTTIKPLYAESFEITFVPDNGESIPVRRVIENEKIGALPVVIKETCPDNSTGTSYYERGCTEGYEFKGWYLEPTFETEVNEDFVPTENTTLYAKWNKVFYGKSEATTFDGTQYIDTGVKLFSEENADRDFIVTFNVDVNNGYPTDRGTIFTNMDEKKEPYPGVHFFFQNNKYTMNINTQGHKVKDSNTGYVTGQKVTIKKEDGIVYYKYDDGPFVQINDFTNFTTYFDHAATFGAGLDKNLNPYRYFDGTLSDMSVEIFEDNSYTIHFDPNGGDGMMVDQSVKVGKTTALKDNTFVKDSSKFVGWNTAADGSGTSYNNKASISNLGAKGDTITLYAQWHDVVEYTIHFNANGGTGTMSDQTFEVEDPQTPLNANTFTRDGYKFVGWNTAADGSGNHYDDGVEVHNLTNEPTEEITLYAQYLKNVYNKPGDTVFDGTDNTFLDTGINMYTSTTIDKDFEIRFTVTAVGSTNNYDNQATIINCKDESNPKWPGFHLRFNKSSATIINPGYKWANNIGSGSTNVANISTSNLPIEFIFRRQAGKVTVQYKYTGYDSGIKSMYNQATWDLDQFFPDNISFGGIYDSNHQPDRFFTGTVSDIEIFLED